MSEPGPRRTSSSLIPTRWRGPLAVLGGGLLGSAARGVIAVAVPAPSGEFPVATLIVNLLGSFLLGFYLARRERAVSARWSLRFWAMGALGSFTTFSTFSLEVFQLIDIGHVPVALGYVGASTLGGLAVALIGDRVGAVTR
ncbi:MAG: fluoride efflux transporter FluC [Acidimicrobiia bacterium]